MIEMHISHIPAEGTSDPWEVATGWSMATNSSPGHNLHRAR
jgi:hypothetical protein